MMNSNEKLALLLQAWEIEQPVFEYKFYPTRAWRFDAAYPELGIAIEIEGGAFVRGAHNRPARFMSDMKKYNAASYLGWRLLRVAPADDTELIRDSFKFVRLLRVLLKEKPHARRRLQFLRLVKAERGYQVAMHSGDADGSCVGTWRGHYKSIAEASAAWGVSKWRTGTPHPAPECVLAEFRKGDRWALNQDIFEK